MVHVAADGVGLVAVAEGEAAVGVEEVDGGGDEAVRVGVRGDAVHGAVLVVADGDVEEVARGARGVARDEGHVDAAVGEDAGARQRREAGQRRRVAPGGEGGDRAGREALAVGGAGGVVLVVGALALGVGEARLELLGGERLAEREAGEGGERGGEVRHLAAEPGEVAGLGDGEVVARLALADGDELEAGAAERGGEGGGRLALAREGEGEGLERGRERLLVERGGPRVGGALAEAALGDAALAVVERADRGEDAHVGAGRGGRVAVEARGLVHRGRPRERAGGEVEVEVADEGERAEEVRELAPGLVVRDHPDELLLAQAQVGDDVGAARLVDLDGLRLVVRAPGVAVELLADGVAGVALGAERGELGGDAVGVGLAAGVARGLLLEVQGGDPRAQAVGHRDEALLEAALHVAGEGAGGGGGDDVVRLGPGEQVARVGELRLVAPGADVEVDGVHVAVGHVERVVEEARALHPAVARAEEDDEDVAGRRPPPRELARHVREERRVGREAQVGREVGREAVGVERGGEHDELLRREAVRPAARAGQLRPEVAALDVAQRRAGVERELRGAVGREQARGLGAVARDVDARHERERRERDAAEAPLVRRPVADEDGGRGAVREALAQRGVRERDVHHGDRALEVLAVDRGEGAVAHEHRGPADRLGNDEVRESVVDHQRALDGLAGVGERKALRDLRERVERLAVRR